MRNKSFRFLLSKSFRCTKQPYRRICAPTSKYDSVMMRLWWWPWIWNFRSLSVHLFFSFGSLAWCLLSYIFYVCLVFGLNLNHRRAISGSSKCPFLRCNSPTLLALFASLRWLLTIDILSHTAYFMTTGKQQKHNYGDIPIIIVPTTKCSAYKQMRKKLQQPHRETERGRDRDGIGVIESTRINTFKFHHSTMRKY